MKIIPTPLEGCFVIEPSVFEDKRGFFYESFNQRRFEEATGVSGAFVQDNIAESAYGVVRGLHLQRPPYAQAKLVTCLQGRVLDVVVDVREGSPTYGVHISIELNAENKRQLYVPKGFLHGYSVLYKTALFAYKCDAYYEKSAEDGINPIDPALGIDWQLKAKDYKLSEKDRNAPMFEQLKAVKF